LDEGAFGSVFDAGDSVIKKGQLGPKEIQALYAMKDSPYFPDLINARFDGPFKHQSSEYNNPLQKSSRKRGQDGQAPNDYWDPQDQSDFDDKYPSAPGTYAMSKAQGAPLYQVWDELDDEAQEKARRQFWEARGQLHQAGISHNDMHDGNIFVDDEGNIQIIDMGLANDNPLSALMEGMGGMDFEQGEDYQLGNYMGGSGAPESLRDRMMENMEGIREMMQDNISLDGSDYDDYDEDEDYSSKMSDATEMLDRIMTGGIRLQPDMIKEISEKIPYLQNKDNVMSLIKRLYQNMGVEDGIEDPSETGQMLQSIKKPEIGGFSGALDRLRGLGVNTTRLDKVKKALDIDD
jgi:serine/threonine protein kinase